MMVFLVPLQPEEHAVKNLEHKPLVICQFDSEMYVWGKTQENYYFVMDNTKQIFLVWMKHTWEQIGAKSGYLTIVI